MNANIASGEDISAARLRSRWRFWLRTNRQALFVTMATSPLMKKLSALFFFLISGFSSSGVHISSAVWDLKLLDMTPVIVDPRPAWGNADRFPDTDIISQWPDEAFADLGLDSGTAVVTLTHDSKFDDPALMAALKSNAFYVGALGGRKTNEKRVDRFRSSGLDEASIDRLHSPVGLNIGAKNPAEIAVSIAAQIVLSRRQA